MTDTSIAMSPLLAVFGAALSLLPFAHPQSSGTITLAVTPPSSSNLNEGCIILAQVASLSSPSVLTRLTPICPSTAGDTASSPQSIAWPLSSAGDGAASSMAIYAGMKGGAPGCVTSLSQMQAMYLLGRDLEWRDDKSELYDNTSDGFLLDPVTFQQIPWYVLVKVFSWLHLQESEIGKCS